MGMAGARRACGQRQPQVADKDLLEPAPPTSQPSGSHTHAVHSWDPTHGGAGRVRLHRGPLAVAGMGTVRSRLRDRQGDGFKLVGNVQKTRPTSKQDGHGVVVMQPCCAERTGGQWHCVRSLGSFLGMQHLRPHPDLVSQNLHLDQMPTN